MLRPVRVSAQTTTLAPAAFIAAAENSLRVSRASLEKVEADYEAEIAADALALRQTEDLLAYAEKALQLFDEVTGKQMLKMNRMTVQFREDSVRDIGALLDFIDQAPELDASRVAVFGASYGGYMALASAVHYSDRLVAAVDRAGISNFVTYLENTGEYRRDLRRYEYGDERDPEMRDFLESISPLNNVDRINIPLLIVQGQNDPVVPVTESEQMVRALRERGQTVWYMNALNEGHGYEKKENRDIYQQVTYMFLEKFLLGQ